MISRIYRTACENNRCPWPAEVFCSVIAACVLLPALLSNRVEAAIVGMDINNGSSTPVNWDVNGGFNLNDEAGNPTAIDILWQGDAIEIEDYAINPSTLPVHTNSLAGLDEYSPLVTSMSFQDLTPGISYDLWLFSYYNGLSTVAFTASIQGASLTTRDFVVPTTNDLYINGALGDDSLSLADCAISIEADSLGEINVEFERISGFSSNDIPLAGAAIRPSVVPEPGIFVWLGGVAILVSATRRGHR